MKSLYKFSLFLVFLLLSASVIGQIRIFPPELRAPEDAAIGQSPEVLLDWYAVTGQTLDITYEVQLATKEDFSDAVTSPRTQVTAMTKSDLVFGQTYFWRVKAYDEEDPSAWSEAWSFTVVSLVTVTAPNNQKEVTTTQLITWEEINGILKYELQVDTTYVWEPQETATGEDVKATFVLGENDQWLVGTGGLVQHYADGAWTTVDVGVTEDLFSVFFVDASNGYVVGEGGTVVNYDGADWTKLDAGTTKNLFGVSFADADNGWVVGEDGTVLNYASGTWTTVSTSVTDDLNSVFTLSTTDVWACGLKKHVLHFDGTDWTDEIVGTKDLYSVWFTDANNGWVVGKSGKIQYYNGTEWIDQKTGITKDLLSVSFSGMQGISVGRDGTMLYYNGTWNPVTSGVSGSLNGIWIKDGQGLSGGDAGEVIRIEGEGFTSPYAHVYNIPGDTTTFEVKDMPFGATVFYRMRAMHAVDSTDWSFARSMLTQASPKLDKPNDGSNDVDLLTEFKWKEYVGAVDYYFEIDDNAEFSSPFEALVDSMSIEFLMDKFGSTYYWRVNAQHAHDISDWSEVWTVETVGTITLLNPDNNETDVSSCPLYDWEEVNGAKEYEIWVDTDPDFIDPMMAVSETPFYQCQSPMEKKTKYFWKVRGIASLDTSSWSQVWSFETEGYAGIGDEFNERYVEIYPNPTDGQFFVNINSLAQDNYNVTIIDLTGRTIHEESILCSSGENKKEFAVNGLRKGIYFVNIRKGNEVVTKKLFVR